MAKNVRVLIVEDHDMARMGLSVVLGNNDKIEVVGMCADGQDGVDKALDLILIYQCQIRYSLKQISCSAKIPCNPFSNRSKTSFNVRTNLLLLS